MIKKLYFKPNFKNFKKVTLAKIFYLCFVYFTSSQVYAGSGDVATFPCGVFLGGKGIKVTPKTPPMTTSGGGTCTVALSEDVLNAIANIASIQDQVNSLKDQNGNKLSASQEGAVMYDDPNVKNKVTLNPGGAGTTITNVNGGNIAAGSKDAINGDQLWQTQNEIQKAKTTVSAGKNIKVTNSINADGSNNYEVSTSDNVTFDKVAVGTVTIDKSNVDKSGNTIITGVGDGSLVASSKDAVNGGQINKIASSISAHLGGGSKFDPISGVVTPPKYTIDDKDYNNVGDAMVAINDRTNKIIKGELGLVQTDGKTTTIDKNGTSSTIDVSGSNGDRLISGVAQGINPNDAVNKSQLDSKFASINSSMNDKITKIKDKIDENRKFASQGIASAVAMNIKYPSQHPGEFATGMGLGTYDGQTSVALGLNWLTESGKVNISGGIGHALGSSSKPAGNLSIGIVW